MTPKALAEELGIKPKKLRDFLRKQFPRLKSQKWKRWDITEGQATVARDHFNVVAGVVVPTTMVLMHFGDGTFKELEMTEENPDDAVEQANTYVIDNAWFEVQDADGQVLASINIRC
jgi:hypothetical protein